MIGAGVNSLRQSRTQLTTATVLPAPQRGMDATANVALDTPDVCRWAINMMPSEYGLKVRSGYREWQIGLGNPVRTIIDYKGLDASARITTRIFATTSTGIYDVTAAGASPTLKHTFATSDDDSGYGVWLTFVDESGDDFIFYADESNGLLKYDPSTDTWAVATGIQAAAGSLGTLDEANIVYIVEHKLRLWLVERDSDKAWYLPIRSTQGDAQEFFFAQKFQHGGDLVGLYNWTVDGGAGRDDHLVAISRGGDVIPWTGEDPADTATWTSTGKFFIGRVPYGRKVAAEYGGELFMLSTLGVMTLSDLLRGGNPHDPFRNQIGYRIADILREDLATYTDSRGWEVKIATSEGALVINMPQRNDTTYRQYVYNLSTGGWGLWKDVPAVSFEEYSGKLMFGTSDGKVMRMDVDADNIQIAGGDPTAVNWFVLTSYYTLESPAQFKRVKFIRPNFVATQTPQFDVKAYYDYRTDVQSDISAGTDLEGDVWDAGVWDTAVWAAGDSFPYHEARGGLGLGRAVAIAMVGNSYTRTFCASWDIMWETGGLL